MPVAAYIHMVADKNICILTFIIVNIKITIQLIHCIYNIAHHQLYKHIELILIK